ncbi:Hypothetical protein PENO1_102650 [Penicillium occitanis (nom. inval.)]|nr:Hypothetical protein PENO1_102650 [Penicillium occitanis (nom. inval.)]PCG90129.1 hypothetical protein PENOC_103490 [Penicillium occitanis (nom. inval.)]
MAPPALEKKRPIHRRSNNGCITCRIRRVKCDEAKPACKRCTSTGRRCDGYRQRQQQQLSKHYMSIGIAMTANYICATPTGRAACEVRSRMSYHLFVELYTPLLSDYGTAGFWNEIVLQASAADESIKHLIIAASSLTASASPVSTSSSPSSTSSIAELSPGYSHEKKNVSFLLHHGRALQLLSHASQPSITIILIACVLLAICDELQHQSTQAQVHIQAGLKILAAHYPDLCLAGDILAEIASTFARLCNPKPVMPGFEELRQSLICV